MWIFKQKLCKPDKVAGYSQSDLKKNKKNKPTTKNILPNKTITEIWRREHKFFREEKARSFQYYYTDFKKFLSFCYSEIYLGIS